MMFSNELSIFELVKRQYLYKLKANVNLFYTVIFLQIIALALSISGTGGSSFNGSALDLNTRSYSANIIIVFTYICSIAAGTKLAAKEVRNLDFTFISNRLSSNLSSLGVLITFNIIAGISASLGGILLRVLSYYLNLHQAIIGPSFTLPISIFVTGTIAGIFYTMLFSSIAYLIGNLFEYNKLLLLLIPALLIILFISVRSNADTRSIFLAVLEFFFYETSLVLFVIKATAISAILFAAGSLLTSRIEVRK